MPGMNGLQLAAAIKQVTTEVPVILLTGFGDEMMTMGAHPAEVDLILGKPLGHDDLRQAIFDACTRSTHRRLIDD